jgi:plasmid maintenance system antidote protein VapI
MKKLFILTIAIMFAVIYLKAQNADPELDYIKKAYSKDKKTIVDQYMNLDVQEGGKFWPVYSEYETSREKLAQERYGLINEYVNNSDKLTPEMADRLAKGVLTNNINLEKLNLDNYQKMKKAVGPIKAAKYLQLETYLQTTWRGMVQDNIPLISTLDKTKQN